MLKWDGLACRKTRFNHTTVSILSSARFIYTFVSVFGLVFMCSFSGHCVHWSLLFPSTLISATISFQLFLRLTFIQINSKDYYNIFLFICILIIFPVTIVYTVDNYYIIIISLVDLYVCYFYHVQ